MSKYVISTLTADNRYVGWHKDNGVNTVERSVLVRGGAGVATPGGGRNVVTPQGVRTEMSDSDADFLLAHQHFQDHMKRGFVRIVNKADDPDKKAQSMEKDEARDTEGLRKAGSKPLTPQEVQEAAAIAAKKQEAGSPELQVVTNKK